jgi:hypothetical protein
MATSHVVQTSFLSGVLDPRASARVETDAFAQGLLKGRNVTPIHLGGVRRRPGLRYRGWMPNQLTRVTSGVTITAPRGGTTANANDDTESTLLTTTVNVSTLNPYVVVQYDLGSAQAILFADVLGIVSTGGSSTQFCVQYSADASNWTTLGSAFATVDTTARHYRRTASDANVTNKATTTSARYWRVAKIGGTDMGAVTITISGFNLWLDSGTVSEGRSISFEVSMSERYKVVLTDRSATVFYDHPSTSWTLTDRQPIPYVSDDLAEIDAKSDVETLALVHEDYPPRFFVRESTTNFQTFEVDFDDIPQIDYADASSPTPTSDVQTITFAAGWVAGDTFQIELEGAKTAAITYAGDNATTAANIAREVQKLWTVQGFSGVSCSRTGPLVFAITLAAASADAYDLMSVTSLSSASSATVVHTSTGVARREPVWSSTRGYPRTVDFFEGRLYFGGTRSRQNAVIGSAVNDILNLQIGEGLDDDAIFKTLNGVPAIQGMFSGRSLQLFASGGEFRYVKEQGVPVTPSDTPVNQTSYGSAKIRPVSIDGATIYVQRNRKSIRDFRFDYTENAYNSLGVSSLAPHLIYDVRDLAAWNGSAVDEIGLVFVVNGTNPDHDAAEALEATDDATATYTNDAGEFVWRHGTVAVFNSRKEANVQAWTIWETDGEFKAVSTILEDIFFLVKRNINGVDVLTFEQADEDYYTDCAVKVTNSPASTTVTGLSHLNGEECRVKADGFVLENVTPSGGSATIQLASEDIEVGLDWVVTITPMPLQTVSLLGSNLLRKRRIVKVWAKVRKSLGLYCNGNPLPDRFFDQDNFDEPASPFTGTHELADSTNWDLDEEKLVEFTQIDPLPLELLAIDVQLAANE